MIETLDSQKSAAVGHLWASPGPPAPSWYITQRAKSAPARGLLRARRGSRCGLKKGRSTKSTLTPRSRQRRRSEDSKKEQQHQGHVNSAFAMDLAYEDDVVDLTERDGV